MERQDILTMSIKELDRMNVIQKVLEKRLKQRRAAAILGLSTRQIIRLCQRVRRQGAQGLIHGQRGRPSHHQLKPGLLDKALGWVKKRYSDFSPTFANEKLETEHGLVLSTWTLRQGMIRTGLWKVKPPKKRHRAWRERRPCVGMLEQLDGSDHPWFEGRGPRCVLLLFIDDATSRILYGEFIPVEDTLNLLRAAKSYLLLHGRPVALYVDRDSIYKINRSTTVEEDLHAEEPLTQFRRAMKELDVDVIFAYSPQAKGRVERSFRTHQNRLVKELRLAGISTVEEANPFLQKVYIPKHNARFAVPPTDPGNAHRPLLPQHKLQEVLSIRRPRVVANDFTLRQHNRFFQLGEDQPLRVRPGDPVFVETRLDGSTHLRFKELYLNFKILDRKPYRPFYVARKGPKPCAKPSPYPWRPPRTHPFKDASYKRMRLKKSAALKRQNLLKIKT